MSEWWRVVLVFFKLQFIVAFAMLYVMGGRKHKWLRRWVGGTVLALSVLIFGAIHNSLNWGVILSTPLIYVGLALGYGGDHFWEKFLRRAFYGLMFSLPAFAISISIGRPMLGLFQIALSVLCSLYLGLINPTEAVDEEAFLAVLSSLCYPFLA